MDSEIEKTLNELDEDIREVNRVLDNAKKYVEDHQSEGLRSNYMGLKYVLDELKSRREKLIEENYDIYIKGKIEELFEHTQDERFMGGKLKYVQVSPDNQYILVESEYRMGSNMMQTLMAMTDSNIILGTENNNVLVFKRNKEE